VRTLAGCSPPGVGHHLIQPNFSEVAKHILQPGGFSCTCNTSFMSPAFKAMAGEVSACHTHVCTSKWEGRLSGAPCMSRPALFTWVLRCCHNHAWRVTGLVCLDQLSCAAARTEA
jgi:hypothetical protein